ncbi:MAG: nucleotidyltransferase domain-containing protein [Eubacterium sp.]|nr:nucleotidyltransferase domain-containing protein [Eubacterium sp.]
MTLKECRSKGNMTQAEAAKKLGISLRSYISYENDDSKIDTIKYKYFLSEIQKETLVDEDHGLLSIDSIKKTCNEVLREYNISFCYLFGSYAKGNPNESSDVDLLVSDEVSGLKFYGMVEVLREKLNKRVDVLDLKQVVNNKKLIKEILKYGVRVI